MPAPYTGRLIDFLGVGIAADRPVTINTLPGALALYFATDSGELSGWDGSTWTLVATAGGAAVTSVNGRTGAVTLNLGDLADVVLSSGSPDAGALLYWDAYLDAWVELGPGAEGTVLEIVGGTPAWSTPPSAPVSSVNGQTGVVSLGLSDLDDVMTGTGSPDVGDILVWNGSEWAATPDSTGNVRAAANLTNDAIVRGDGGTTGVQTTGVVISDADEISGYLAKINFQTGTSYTIDVAGSDSDTGKIIDHSNAGAIAVTLPNSAPVGFACTYVQSGAGQITFSAQSGGTLRNRQSHTKTAGQWGEVALYVRANSGGSAAEWVLGGDTA